MIISTQTESADHIKRKTRESILQAATRQNIYAVYHDEGLPHIHVKNLGFSEQDFEKNLKDLNVKSDQPLALKSL
jgi:hypothetical protein